MAKSTLDSLEKLSKRMDADLLTKEDFLASFQIVTKYILDFKGEVLRGMERLGRKVNDAIQSIKDDTKARNEKNLAEIQSLRKQIESKSSELDRRITQRLAELKNGEDADPEYVAELVRSQLFIPTAEDVANQFPQLGERVRDSLELLQAGEKLRPEAIEGLMDLFKEMREEIRSMRSRAGGGGTSAIGVANALGFSGKTETPSGDIDGANTTYTVTKPINFVFSFMINGEAIPSSAYTVAGKTIEFGTALPAAYSGKDFEIKYI